MKINEITIQLNNKKTIYEIIQLSLIYNSKSK